MIVMGTSKCVNDRTADFSDKLDHDRPAWHWKPELNGVVEKYYQKFGKQPDSAEAKQQLLKYLDIIRKYLEQQGVPCQGFQFVGSTYEGLKVDDGLEFDVFVILDGHGFDVLQGPSPDYNFIKPRPGIERGYFRSSIVNDNVSAEKLTRKFQGYMAKLNSTSIDINKEVVPRFRTHGPAIQMDVSRYGRFWFSVDLVPTYAIDGSFYVAKPHGHERSAWLHSFSVEMKQKLEVIDRDNGRRKQVLRTLKVMCHRESTLKSLSSHHLKMLLFSYLEDNICKTWKPDQLGLRLLDLIKRLQNYLDSGHYPHFFLPLINMIDRLATITRENMARRLEKLYNSETAFMKVVQN